MRNQGTVLLRAHTDGGKTNKQKTPGSKGVPQPKWAPYALIIDTETTTDELQTLILLGYRFCKLDDQGYAGVEEGIVFPDGLPENDAAACGIVKKYQSRHQSEAIKGFSTKLKLHSRSEFFKQVFWRAVEKLGAVVVAFNLPFDLSRLAVDVRVSRKVNTGWTFVMSQDKCTLSGKLRADPMAPRVRLQPVDSKSAFIELTGVGVLSRKSKKRLKPFVRGRFLDLRTLGWALRNESFSLESASAKFLGSSKLNHQPCGKITREEIEYCRHDVRLTARLLNAMRDDFELHPIRLNPEQAYSPASIAKAYLDAMGIIPPSQKFQIPDRATGVAMQTYCGGRAECRIRHVVVPVVHTDVLSEYPTINPLSGLWSLLTAKELRFEDATPDVRRFLSHVTPELVCQPEFWKELRFFALVKPNHTILPVRANYAATNSNIGVNPLTSNVPIWYAGPDLVAAILAGSEPPEIIEALRMVSEGQQAGLKPVTLRGSVFIDPSKSDFFRLVIESRQRIKKDSGLPKSQRDALGYFLKILANAGSYGLFVEVNPEVLPKGKRHKIKVFSGEVSFSTTTPVVERPGTWYCPPIAALITAGGRLLLALIERLVIDAGGTYMLCDTDSMAIVATQTGGLVPCDGGSNTLADGRKAIKALSWSDVDKIVAKLDLLNPYDRGAVTDPILKLEDVNFIEEGGIKQQRQLFGYMIAAKRYVMFTRDQETFSIVKASAHGLGYLFPPIPRTDFDPDTPQWVVDAWAWILQGVLGVQQVEPAWFDVPAMMRFRITTPNVLKALQARLANLDYAKRVKPFNFVQCPILQETGGYPIQCEDRDKFTLIAPHSSDASNWYQRKYTNIYNGTLHTLAKPGMRRPSDAEAKTLRDVISQYRWHPEAKSLAPGGSPCLDITRGLLLRTPITASCFVYIGKETDRKWEQGEDISMLDPSVLEYRPGETDRLVVDVELQVRCRQVSIRQLAKMANVTENTVKAARRGERLRKANAEKLRCALEQP